MHSDKNCDKMDGGMPAGDHMGGMPDADMMGESPGPQMKIGSAFTAVMGEITTAVVGLVSIGVSPDAALNVSKEVWNKVINHDLVTVAFACGNIPTAEYNLPKGKHPRPQGEQRFQRTVRNDPKGAFRAECFMSGEPAKPKADKFRTTHPLETLRNIIRSSGMTPDDLRKLAFAMENGTAADPAG